MIGGEKTRCVGGKGFMVGLWWVVVGCGGFMVGFGGLWWVCGGLCCVCVVMFWCVLGYCGCEWL